MLTSIRSLPSQRFGCRLMAYASNKPGNNQASLLKASLMTDANSLKNQSLQMGDALHKHGWGLLAYHAQGVLHRRSKEPVSTGQAFPQGVTDVLKQQPSVLLAHIRKSSPAVRDNNDGDTILLDNVHPFTYADPDSGNTWGFMHNGDVDAIFTNTSLNHQVNLYATDLQTPIKGTTDSERIFIYFLGKLKEQHGTVNTQQIGLDGVTQTFQETIDDLTTASGLTNPFQRLNGSQKRPLCVFVVTDGQILLASVVNHPLMMGRPKDAPNDLLLASEASQSHAVNWTRLPQGTIITADLTQSPMTVNTQQAFQIQRSQQHPLAKRQGVRAPELNQQTL